MRGQVNESHGVGVFLERWLAKNPHYAQNPSMSSIKRDVKKKAPPRPEARFLSRDPAHCRFIPRKKFAWLSILVSFSDGEPAFGFERAASEMVFQGNHGSIRGSFY